MAACFDVNFGPMDLVVLNDISCNMTVKECNETHSQIIDVFSNIRSVNKEVRVAYVEFETNTTATVRHDFSINWNSIIDADDLAAKNEEYVNWIKQTCDDLCTETKLNARTGNPALKDGLEKSFELLDERWFGEKEVVIFSSCAAQDRESICNLFSPYIPTGININMVNRANYMQDPESYIMCLTEYDDSRIHNSTDTGASIASSICEVPTPTPTTDPTLDPIAEPLPEPPSDPTAVYELFDVGDVIYLKVRDCNECLRDRNGEETVSLRSDCNEDRQQWKIKAVSRDSNDDKMVKLVNNHLPGNNRGLYVDYSRNNLLKTKSGKGVFFSLKYVEDNGKIYIKMMNNGLCPLRYECGDSKYRVKMANCGAGDYPIEVGFVSGGSSMGEYFDWDQRTTYFNWYNMILLLVAFCLINMIWSIINAMRSFKAKRKPKHDYESVAQNNE